ncbi:hypothetical protein RBWH47_02227 [Rhodopirellula baltica WH47]|uniref:Uncharacterized protein n=1 Tax=Rhodopirellula baltica WH47 TaxID=991778 RepID=F2AKA8_RHOBT|nr:hypothetical protein RBWH47_02227 [Rhodopirellula baltica WH47]
MHFTERLRTWCDTLAELPVRNGPTQRCRVEQCQAKPQASTGDEVHKGQLS